MGDTIGISDVHRCFGPRHMVLVLFANASFLNTRYLELESQFWYWCAGVSGIDASGSIGITRSRASVLVVVWELVALKH